MNKKRVGEIVGEVAAHFRKFGGSENVRENPIAAAMEGCPPQFAAGVEVEAVVRFVLSRANQ